MDFQESAERENGRELADREPGTMKSCSNTVRTYQDILVSSMLRRPFQAMRTNPPIPPHPQPMQALFSMEEVNNRLENGSCKPTTGPPEHSTSRYSDSPSMTHHQRSIMKHPPQPSQSSPSPWTSPAGYPPTWNAIWTPPTAPRYATLAPQENLPIIHSAVPLPGRSATRQMGEPALLNHDYPLSSHIGQPVPQTNFHPIPPVPQLTDAEYGTPPSTMLPSTSASTAMAPPPSPLWLAVPSPSTRCIPAPPPDWLPSTSQGSGPVMLLQNSLPTSPYLQSPSTGFSPTLGASIPCPPFPTWSQATPHAPGPTAVPQTSMPASPYLPPLITGFATAPKTNIPPPPYPIWTPIPSQDPRYVALPLHSVPASPYIQRPSTGFTTTPKNSIPPKSPAIPQTSVLLGPCPQSGTASSISSSPFNPPGNWGQLAPSETDCCTLTSCNDRCSLDPCPSGCSPSCNGSEACNSVYECTGSCRAPGSNPGSQPLSRSLSMRTPNLSLGNSMQCKWLLPGQQCDVSTSDKGALGQHVLQEHIQPQTALTCPWDQCAATLDQHLMPFHMMQQHHPDSYVCLFQHCGQSFPRAEDLDIHFQSGHGSLDCHWAGCDVITLGPGQLKDHVDTEHLKATQQVSMQASPCGSANRKRCQDTPAGSSKAAIGKSWNQLSDTDKMLINMSDQGASWAQINAAWEDATGNTPAASTLPNRLRRIRDRLADHAAQVSGLSNLLVASSLCLSPAYPDHQVFQFAATAPPSPMVSSFGAHQFTPSASLPATPISPSFPPGVQCLWSLNSSTSQICGEHFQTGNDLQAHVERAHIYGMVLGLPSNTSPTVVCQWSDCKRMAMPLQSTKKLTRHLYTHTGCK